MSLGRIDAEQEEFTLLRQAAIENSGHEFISLRLKDNRYRNVAGIMEMNATPYTEGMEEKWHFQLIGGCAHFQRDKSRGGGFYDKWVKVEHNMKFLASHWDEDPLNRYWEIEDKNIEKEVIKIYRQMAKVARTVPLEIVQLKDKIKDIDNQLLICDKVQEPLLRQRKQELLERIVKMATGSDSLMPENTPQKREEPLSDVVNVKTNMGIGKM